MNWRTLPASLAPRVLLALALLLPRQALADFGPAPAASDASQLCRRAIAVAERAYGIPPQLLAAIARTESGRRDPVSGTYNPWPWTINKDGQGSFYDSKLQAVAAAETMRPRVVRSIDVGCMQISMTQHPNAFANMDQAFDPASNADYGARFLMQLFEKTASWPKAVAWYHSATPGIGDDYQAKVYAFWSQEQKVAIATPLTAAPAPRQMPVVLPMSTTSPWTGGWNRSSLTAALPASAPRIIPQVIGPSGSIATGRTLESYRALPVRMAVRMQ